MKSVPVTATLFSSSIILDGFRVALAWTRHCLKVTDSCLSLFKPNFLVRPVHTAYIFLQAVLTTCLATGI
jgi:hypothetical protein